MTRVSLAIDRWLPLMVVLVAASIVGTIIVTVWPPYG